MAVIRSGASSSDLTVDTTFLSARVTTYPLSGVLGEYSLAGASGPLVATIAASAPLFSFRWNSGTTVALLRSVIITGVQVLTTITTAVTTGVDVIICRGFTASDTGGVQLTFGASQKKRTSYGSSLVADMRLSLNNALVAGTRVVDTYPIGLAHYVIGTVALTQSLGVTRLYAPTLPDEAPIVLAANEGFIIRNTDTGPTTGTWRMGFNISWVEMSSYPT